MSQADSLTITLVAVNHSIFGVPFLKLPSGPASHFFFLNITTFKIELDFGNQPMSLRSKPDEKSRESSWVNTE